MGRNRGSSFFVLLASVFILIVIANCGSSSSEPHPAAPPATTEITSHPSDVTVTEPDSAAFSVTATGDGPLSYQWRRDGVDIPGDTGDVYTLDPTTIADDGVRFSVVVAGPHGSVTSRAAVLTVHRPPQPPTIVVQPSDVTVTEPDSAAFSVTATGDGPLSYRWLRNGIALPMMTAYWPLDEAGGPAYRDAYGDSHALCAGGVNDNCPINSPGRVNGAQAFNGIHTGLDVPAAPAFNWNGDESFSIAVWVKAEPGQACASNDQTMVGRVDDHTGLRWSLGCVGGSGHARFQLIDADSTEVTLTSDTPVTTGRWHHIVAVRDGEHHENALYVDGNLVASDVGRCDGGFASMTAPLNLGYLDSGAYFEGVLDEVGIFNGVLSDQEIRAHYFISRGYMETCDMPVRIMPLGDSITRGSSSGVDNTQEQLMISYRKDLWDLLVKNGHDVNFVGSLQGGWDYAGFDPDHEGHSGKTDQYVSQNVYGWLGANPADVVLLHIGTNARTSDSSRYVKAILDEIDWYERVYETRVAVVLARIINRNIYHALTTAYNDNVATMAQARIDDDGDAIIIVDMEEGAGLDYRLYPTGDMWDNLHPYATGYAKMADVWFGALDGMLPDCRWSIAQDTLTLAQTRAADDGSQFSVVVSSPYGSITSRAATLWVD